MLSETAGGVRGMLLICQGQTRSSCHEPSGPSWFMEFYCASGEVARKMEGICPVFVRGINILTGTHYLFKNLH